MPVGMGTSKGHLIDFGLIICRNQNVKPNAVYFCSFVYFVNHCQYLAIHDSRGILLMDSLMSEGCTRTLPERLRAPLNGAELSALPIFHSVCN